jgi:hypothetical protein
VDVRPFCLQRFFHKPSGSFGAGRFPYASRPFSGTPVLNRLN